MNPSTRLAAIFSLTLIALAVSAEARAASIRLAGREMNCAAASRVIEKEIPSVAAAFGESRSIVLHPKRFFKRAPEVQWFMFNHECGHLTLGGGTEKQADLFAIDRGYKQGWVNDHAIQEICDEYLPTEGGPRHPPGHVRCAYMEKRFLQLAGKSKGRDATREQARVDEIKPQREQVREPRRQSRNEDEVRPRQSQRRDTRSRRMSRESRIDRDYRAAMEGGYDDGSEYRDDVDYAD